MNTKGMMVSIITAMLVVGAMVALAMPVGASVINLNYDTGDISTMSSWSSGAIPCSNVCPAPDDNIYTISVPSSPPCGIADVDITVRDAFWVSDRYQVWVDGVLIGTTPTETCGGLVYSQGTFRATIAEGDHTLQFKNTCEPCFTGSAPCYNGWLPSGFYYMVAMSPHPDTTPPDISVTVTPDTLWPPNHKMVDIVAAVTVSDICDAAPIVVLTSVTSNEPDNDQGKPYDPQDSTSGDGNTINDIQGAVIGTEDYEFQLRAERAGAGDGRIYTIT